MATIYNLHAGQSVERLAALSDGIFGVAMTLLLLELHVPLKEAIHGEVDLARALAGMLPQLLVYLMSFVILGIFWVGQQTQLNHLERSDRHLTWIHLGFLFCITLLPFSTRLLAEFITYRTALLVYWFNIMVLGLFLYFCWSRSNRAGLVKENVSKEIRAAVFRRIVIAQALYVLGASLCYFSTYWSIGFIAILQLNYAIAPDLWGKNQANDRNA